MSRRYLADSDNFNNRLESVIDNFSRRVKVAPPGICPLTVHYSLLITAMQQTCGKCVPCRNGLPELAFLMERIISGKGKLRDLTSLKSTAQFIANTADCAIGFDAAENVLSSIDVFGDEYMHHILHGECSPEVSQKIPCVNQCPAHVDIPGYISLVKEDDCAGAINLIRRDNPLPTACAMICEHPCEERCRRTIIDAPLNIRGIKKYAVDRISADKVATPDAAPLTGKKVAVIGGGPAGLTAAYFLSLMGHKTVIFERQEALGGMLRYGIPNYRFPKERLDEDINAILSTGNIEVRYNTDINDCRLIKEINDEYDAMFVAIGAQKGKTLRIFGNDAGNVVSAVDILDRIGHGIIPDYKGKTVAVIGGGNVAMDCARSAVRCGAEEVKVVYRRRKEDMTALETEIEAAMQEGIEFITLNAPKEIESDEDGNCAALWTQPQMISEFRSGRPAPKDAAKPSVRISCDVIMIAVGQSIVSEPFEEFGMPADRNVFQALNDTSIPDLPGIFTGGDCATGPSTAIKAIAAGKVAAYNIDEYLGYSHDIKCGAQAAVPSVNDAVPTGRINIEERSPKERKCDFEHVELRMSAEEALQEAGRCLRCDCYGCGPMESAKDL